MGLILALVAAFIGLFAAPAVAQDIPSMTLLPGEAVAVRMEDGGQVVLDRGKAEWSKFDVYAARQLVGITPPDAPLPVAAPFSAGDGDPRPAPIPNGLVSVRLHSVAGKHTLLVIENGLRRAIAYRARITAEGDTRPTDVCVVMPGLPSYEHWPHPIDSIELSNFRQVSWQPGQPPACE